MKRRAEGGAGTGRARAMCALAMALAAGAAAAAAPGRTEGFVTVPQGRLWYDAAGEGEPLVLLHDGLVPSETWDAQVAPLARYYRVVRYDRRRYGRSETSSDDYSQVDDLRAVLEHLKLPRAVLVGCSSGGGIALDFALAHPDRVAALVLVGPVVSGFSYSSHFFGRGFRNRAPALAGQPAAAVESWAQDAYLTDARSTAARARLRELLQRHPFAATGGNPGGRPPERPALGRLGEVHVPTLLITGASDIPDVHAHIGAIAAGISGAERILIPEAGHLPHLEKPEAFNEEVLEFLAPPAVARETLDELRAAPAAPPSAFAYDAAAPLDAREHGAEERPGARVVDVSYASPRGGRVTAYLVVPARAGRGPGVLFLHHGLGSRKTFVDEAVDLARAGVVSLTIDAPSQRPGAPQPGWPWWDLARDRAEVEQTVVDLRRGLDLLAARPEVDPRRLGYVGYSLGATVGARLAGIEPRIKAHVHTAGYVSHTRAHRRDHHAGGAAFRNLLPAAGQAEYLRGMAPLDGVHFLGRREGRPLLLQFARRDEWISRFDAALFREAGQPAEERWYEASHFELESGPARADRRAFLARHLGFDAGS
jgi:3-oxoadipate enol-lactonase